MEAVSGCSSRERDANDHLAEIRRLKLPKGIQKDIESAAHC